MTFKLYVVKKLSINSNWWFPARICRAISQGNLHQIRVIYARRPICVGLHLTATPPSVGRVKVVYMWWSTSDCITPSVEESYPCICGGLGGEHQRHPNHTEPRWTLLRFHVNLTPKPTPQPRTQMEIVEIFRANLTPKHLH